MPRFKLAILRAVFRIPCTTNLRNHCSVRRISGNPRGRGASRDCGAAAQKRIQRRCRKAMHAEHADASVRLQDRRSRIRYRPTRVAGIGSQVEPRPCPHRRVLRGSPCCICVEILALRCRGPMLAHSLAVAAHAFWRYTLALRVYGAPFWLWPTAALRGSCDFRGWRQLARGQRIPTPSLVRSTGAEVCPNVSPIAEASACLQA